MTPKPTYAVTGIGGGSSGLIREFITPFVEELLEDAQAMGCATELPPVQVGDETINLAPAHGPAIAYGATELVFGLMIVVTGQVTAGALQSLGNDIYQNALKRPFANLVRRIRRNPQPPATRFRLLADVWFTENELLVQVEVTWTPEDEPPDAGPLLAQALQVAGAFVEQSTPAGPGTEPRTVRIAVGPDGSMTAPAFVDLIPRPQPEPSPIHRAEHGVNDVSEVEDRGAETGDTKG